MNINIFKNYVYSLYFYLIVGIVILAILSIVLTKKYNWRIKKYYSIFFDLSIRELLVYSCLFLNVVYVAYFSICDSQAAEYGIWLIIINSLISATFSWNIKVVIQEAINLIVMTSSIYLLSLVKDYLNIIIFDKKIYVLEIILISLNIIYSIILSLRNVEVILKRHAEKRKYNEGRVLEEKEQKE